MALLLKAVSFHFVCDGFKPRPPVNGTGFVTGNWHAATTRLRAAKAVLCLLVNYHHSITIFQWEINENMWGWLTVGQQRRGQRKEQRDRLMARQCVGPHVINQSLVILSHYSDPFVRLPQTLSCSRQRTPVCILRRPGGRMMAWKGKGARPEHLYFTARETQLLHWKPAAWRGLGLIESCCRLLLLHWVTWPKYHGRDANLPFPLWWYMSGSATRFNGVKTVLHPEEGGQIIAKWFNWIWNFFRNQ